MGGRGPGAWNICFCFPQAIGSEVDHSGTVGTYTDAHTGMLALQAVASPAVPAPHHFFLQMSFWWLTEMKCFA